MVTKDQFTEWARRNGYRISFHGHAAKEYKGEEYRYHIGKNRVKLEKAWRTSDGEKRWTMIHGAYYKNIEITEDDKLKGFKR